MFQKSIFGGGLSAVFILAASKVASAEELTRETSLAKIYEEAGVYNGVAYFCNEGQLVEDKCLIGVERAATNSCGNSTFSEGKCHRYLTKETSSGCSATNSNGDFSVGNYCDSAKDTALRAEGLPCGYRYQLDQNVCSLVGRPSPKFSCVNNGYRVGVTETNIVGRCVVRRVEPQKYICKPPLKKVDGGCASTSEEKPAVEFCPDEGFSPKNGVCLEDGEEEGEERELHYRCADPGYEYDWYTEKCQKVSQPELGCRIGTIDQYGLCYHDINVGTTVDCEGGFLDEKRCSVNVIDATMNGCRDGYYLENGGCKADIATDATFSCNSNERLVYPKTAVDPICMTVTQEKLATARSVANPLGPK